MKSADVDCSTRYPTILLFETPEKLELVEPVLATTGADQVRATCRSLAVAARFPTGFEEPIAEKTVYEYGL